ncbi:hypothetical protein SPHINGO8BC_110034 [Sphingobacterium multivorum]|uniref:Uncharacterized protein n=1 Tax=Sphingobacterium multivorum TaxID=28454 RepID=A0A653Y1P0_SPHMU|nr:hypothetical protein SPHINGO8BC_110034 [Sphingobacterium multivorum]
MNSYKLPLISVSLYDKISINRDAFAYLYYSFQQAISSFSNCLIHLKDMLNF